MPLHLTQAFDSGGLDLSAIRSYSLMCQKGMVIEKHEMVAPSKVACATSFTLLPQASLCREK